jgi:IclR family acetate operon transcriptional repressor
MPGSRMTAELRPKYGALVTQAAQRVSATLGYRRPV